MHLWLFFLVLLLMTVTGCQTSATAAVPASAWGQIVTLGTAEQTHAPAVWPHRDGVTAAWVGADETGVYQFMRTAAPGGLSEINPLPLPPVYPHEQMLFPAAHDHMHLLWLDAAYDDPDAGVRLWSAVVTPDLLVERGPVRVNQPPIYHYTALANSDHSVWVAWSGGLLAEPTLYAQVIDSVGRPRQPVQLVTGADWPALVRTSDGRTLLFWLSVPNGMVYRATLTDEALTDIAPLTNGITLERGDRLANFSVGLDATHAYLLWNIVRASGEAQTWFTSSTLDAEAWTSPARLGVSVTSGTTFETGFNGGAAQAVAPGENWLRWAAPMAGQFDTLAVAAQVGGDLGVVYLRGGEVRGYQSVAALGEIGLLDVPVLYTDRSRHLYLAWSRPEPQAAAELRLTTTR